MAGAEGGGSSPLDSGTAAGGGVTDGAGASGIVSTRGEPIIVGAAYAAGTMAEAAAASAAGEATGPFDRITTLRVLGAVETVLVRAWPSLTLFVVPPPPSTSTPRTSTPPPPPPMPARSAFATAVPTSDGPTTNALQRSRIRLRFVSANHSCLSLPPKVTDPNDLKTHPHRGESNYPLTAESSSVPEPATPAERISPGGNPRTHRRG